jgi:protein-tyrosine-phosphatase
MAQAILERLLAERHARGIIHVLSGGIGSVARDGMIPSLDARIVLREDGIHLAETTITSTDLRQHPEVVAAADVIVTMTAEQKESVRRLANGRAAPLYTLRELAGEAGDIGDPVGQGEDTYRACRDEIKRCLAQSMDRLLRTLRVEVPR